MQVQYFWTRILLTSRSRFNWIYGLLQTLILRRTAITTDAMSLVIDEVLRQRHLSDNVFGYASRRFSEIGVQLERERKTKAHRIRMKALKQQLQKRPILDHDRTKLRRKVVFGRMVSEKELLQNEECLIRRRTNQANKKLPTLRYIRKCAGLGCVDHHPI